MEILKTWLPSKEQKKVLFASMNNLAFVEEAQGKYVAAEADYQDLAKQSEKAFGHDDSGTLGFIHNLAQVYREEAESAEAVETERIVVAGWERKLGPNRRPEGPGVPVRHMSGNATYQDL